MDKQTLVYLYHGILFNNETGMSQGRKNYLNRSQEYNAAFLPACLPRPHASRHGAEPPARPRHLRIPEAAPAMEEDQELEKKNVWSEDLTG